MVYGEEQDFFERDARGSDRHVAVAGVSALLGAGNEADDNGSEPVEGDEAVVFEVSVLGGSAAPRAGALGPPIAPGSEGWRPGGSISVLVLGDGGVIVLGEGPGVVVPDECRSTVSVRWPALGPGHPGNTPVMTRIATAAAATTAAPMTRAATTQPACVASRCSS